MKIAYLVNQYPAPTHTFIRREIQALEAQGVEVLRYSVRRSRSPLTTEADHQELARTRIILSVGALGLLGALLAVVVTRPVRLARAVRLAIRLGWRSDRGLPLHLVYVAEACVLVRWLRAAGADHLHAHFGTNPAAVAALCRTLGGPPYSFTVHGPEEFDRPEALKLREKIEGAAFVVAISSFGRSQLCRWARHEDWARLEVVRCGLDGSLLGATPTPVPAVPRFVCVARISEQKGHLLLMEAAARLAAEGVPFEIVLVGDGPMRGQVEALVRQHHLEDRVRLAGWMSSEQVRTTIEGSRALLLPSFAEGLPVVVMESLALGRPVITTAIAGIPELVEPGVTGWLVPAGSVEALVEAMRAALAASPDRLGEMGRTGAARVARFHDASREAAKLARLFQASASSGPVGA